MTPSVEYTFAAGSMGASAGTVSVWNDARNVHIQISVATGLELESMHVCASTSAFSWEPPGSCPYANDNLPAGTTEHVLVIAIDDLAAECDGTLVLQVHGTVREPSSGMVDSAYAGTFKGQVTYVVDCGDTEEHSAQCLLTQGYWKNHPENWPVLSLTLGATRYEQPELLRLLRTPPQGDASLVLGHQLIAAKLNVAMGAGAPDTLTKADGWMIDDMDADARLPYGTPRGPAADEAVRLAGILDRYNNGDL